MYSFDKRVAYSEVDSKRELSSEGILNYLQDCATFQSEDVGFGLEYLLEHNMGWFVTNYDISINRLPVMGERVKITTYPYKFRGMLGYRGFVVQDEKENILFTADSLWVLMDLQSGKPIRVPEDMKEAYDIGELPSYIEETRSKLRLVDDSKEVDRFVVQRMHIDTNSHMNNAYYVDITSKYLPEGFQCKTISINFMKPALLDQEVLVKKAPIEGGYQIALGSLDDTYAIVEYK